MRIDIPGLMPASANSDLSLIEAMFSKAVEWEMGKEKNLTRARRLKRLVDNNRRLRYPSLEKC